MSRCREKREAAIAWSNSFSTGEGAKPATATVDGGGCSFYEGIMQSEYQSLVERLLLSHIGIRLQRAVWKFGSYLISPPSWTILYQRADPVATTSV